jgi:tetratricopeptide (TPR) repeat protein
MGQARSARASEIGTAIAEMGSDPVRHRPAGFRTASRLAIAIVIAGGLARTVAADATEADADRRFRALIQRAGEARAPEVITSVIDELEQLGAARPVTRWSDDAWAEAARLAERAGDFARARRAHEQVIALGSDEALVRRSRATLERIARATGDGRWDGVAREHERLAAEMFAGGDPRAALGQLEQLVRANRGYPRAEGVWLLLAQAWEREGDADRAIALLGEQLQQGDAATGGIRLRTALVRVAIRRGELATARRELAILEAGQGADRAVNVELRERLAIAERRATIRLALWIALAVVLAAALLAVRRTAGSWRAASRALARPPGEVVFLLPVGAVLVAVAQTGNPLVARALVGIVVAGLAVAWLSGVVLELQRGRLVGRRIAIHAALALAAIAAAAYLAIDRDRMLDLIDETIEHGPAR